jgi:hypothetical protein
VTTCIHMLHNFLPALVLLVALPRGLPGGIREVGVGIGWWEGTARQWAMAAPLVTAMALRGPGAVLSGVSGPHGCRGKPGNRVSMPSLTKACRRRRVASAALPLSGAAHRGR